MKKFSVLAIFFFFIFSAIPAMAAINWMGNSVEESVKKFSGGVGMVWDGAVGVVNPIFEDSKKSDLGYVVGGAPHGAVRGALSVLGSGGAKTTQGLDGIVSGLVGWIPVAGPILGGASNMIFGGSSAGFNWFGETVGSVTSKMHPTKN